MIKFTIITVTYNAETVIGRTLDSVLGQEYPLTEHLIIDGKSKDDTVSKAYIYKEVSDRSKKQCSVRIISEPDRGLYDAMNKGLRMATGDYVCFLNAGDSLPDSHTLDEMVRNAGLDEIQEQDGDLPAVLYGETDLVDNDGRYLRPRRLKVPRQLTWKSFRYGMLVCHQAFYARTDIAKATEFDLKYRLSGDVDWCIRVMKAAERLRLPLVNVGRVIADYQQEGSSTVNHRASLMERFAVIRKHYGLLCTAAMHAWFVIRAVIKK